jgi:hypothetical protein
MRGSNSLARRASLRRGDRFLAVSRKTRAVARTACVFALLLALAAPALFSGAGAHARNSAPQDAGAQDAKAKSARGSKNKRKKTKDEGARGESADDSRDADDGTRNGADEGARDASDDPRGDKNVRGTDVGNSAQTPLLISPPPASHINPAPSAQGKSAGASGGVPATQSNPAASTQGGPATAAQSQPATTQTKPAPSSQKGGAKTSAAAVNVSPVSVTQVNFRQLAKRSALAPATDGPAHMLAIHPPLSIPDSPAVPARAPKRPQSVSSTAPAAQGDTTGGPAAPSPSPSQSFLAQEDGPKTGTTTFTIPPDTMGAVGLDKVFVNTNQNYRVEDKTTGAPLSTVSMDTFWSSSGGSGFFDPRITFDPYNQRWILVADSNSSAANSSVEIAVSQTADPQGTYNVYRFTVGCAPLSLGCSTSGEWADFPMLGFNKNWIAVSMNMFEINGTGGGGAQNFVEGRVLVLDYPQARTGTIASGHATLFAGSNVGFCLHPVETYDPTQDTLYLPQHLSSAGATYALSTVTGTPGSPTLTIDADEFANNPRVRPGGAWQQPGGDILPQTCNGTAGVTCPNSLRFIDVGDAQIRGNAVFRNNHIYYTQTVGLPAGPSALTHTATQWTKLNTDGTFSDGGRIEDPTATNANGGKWYAYSSIAVNHNDDFLVGFSQFASNQFASAGYAYHDHTDAAGSTRDPFIFKSGEDYYAKTFSGSRNRWGDYSHTVVDPFNDTDIWTIQEYAQQRTAPDANTVSNNSRWGTWWAKLPVANAGEPGGLIISEFRLRGPAGAQDEYVEIYNASGSPITVQAGDGSQGYGLFASDATLRFFIPNGTVIPARGHFLGVNSAGYSLSSYPAGSTTTANGDATYTTDIADNVGIALFNTTDQTHLLTATRFDAVGSNVELNTLFKEGGGYPAIVPTNLEYAFVRDLCGKGGSTATAGPCPADGSPRDTGDNASDFFFVDTTGTDIGAGARLGAPGPENSHSPVQRNDAVTLSLLDPVASSSLPPNRFRDATQNTPNSTLGPFGTLSIRRTVTNNTGQAVTRLRFRVIDLSTFNAPLGTADLRVITSGATPATVSITGSNAACPSNNCTVQQTTLEEPPTQTSVAGGGFNSSLAVNAVGPGPAAGPSSSGVSVALGTPIPPGGSINVQIMLGVRQPGNFRIFVNVEAETAAP